MRPDNIQNSFVSVIIPLYNAVKTIERSVMSVVGQKGVCEIIIIDDGSSDGSDNIVLRLALKFPLINLIKHTVNKGSSAARNTGIDMAVGEYLAFLDADDVWLAGKLEKQLAYIVNKPSVTLVTCDSLQLDPQGNILKRGHKNRVPVAGIDSWKTLFLYNFIPTPTVLVRRADVLTVGKFSLELSVAEDLDLWIRLSLLGSVAVVTDVFVHYYDYQSSLMKSKGRQTENIIMSVVTKYLKEKENKLSVKEIRYVYGCRNFEFGLDSFFSGEPSRAVVFFLRAFGKRYRVLKTSQYILRSLLVMILRPIQK